MFQVETSDFSQAQTSSDEDVQNKPQIVTTAEDWEGVQTVEAGKNILKLQWIGWIDNTK